MAHDPSASQATFVEISFGINILWGAFERFNDVFSKLFSRKMKERIASFQAMESKNENSGTRLANLKEKINAIDSEQQENQRLLLKYFKVFALLTAVACVVVVYFDLLEKLGWKLIFLILPLPLHMAFALIIYGIISIRIWWIAKGYKDFIKTFEKCPSAIENTLKTLDDSTPKLPPPKDPPK